MSGVEIAGFVLGGFPLLISAAEHYKEGFEPLVKWKRFRTDFINFIDAVDIEKQLFDQVLERFLISADVPQEELQCFMTIPKYNGWQREDLVELLQSRLGSSYGAFLSTINAMKKLMGDLQTLLSLKNGKVDWAKDDASRWDYQLKRIHLSFSKRGTKTLAALETHNRKLRELLDSHDKLDSLKAIRKDTTWGTVFECIRRHANSLHTAITNGWHCDCQALHPTALRLQRRTTGGWTSNFNVAFMVSKDLRKPLLRRELMIRVNQADETDMPSAHSSPALAKHEYLTNLRRDFESKPEVNIVSRPILPTSNSSSSTSSHFKLKRYAKADSPQNGNANGTEVFQEDKQIRSWLSSRKNKPKKSVRMDVPMENAIDVPTPITVEAPPATIAQIEDLCSTLSQLDPNAECGCIGYLSDDEDRHHELRPIKEAQRTNGAQNLVSLEDLLARNNGVKLNRHERYKVASILANSMLQLQSTPWLADKMEKKNIFFYQQDSKILIEHPYIQNSFPSKKIGTSPAHTPPPPTRFAVRNSLSNLGILLLELCFGQAIENQDMRKCYLGADGKAHEGTDYMTARDWAEIVCDEEPALEHIIKCCVFCVFEEKADWDNKKFTQAVYASVVEPLENFIGKWSAI